MTGRELFERYKGRFFYDNVNNTEGIICGHEGSDFVIAKICNSNGWLIVDDGDEICYDVANKLIGADLFIYYDEEEVEGLEFKEKSIKIINKSKNELPSYSTEGSAGLDLRADIEDTITIEPFQRVLIPTGLYMQLPEGHEAQIRPRSGLALKHGITVLNTPGTIDEDYNGEIKVMLINLSNEPFKVRDGDRICQMVVAKYEKVGFVEVEQLDETERGDGGFGHTGVK